MYHTLYDISRSLRRSPSIPLVRRLPQDHHLGRACSRRWRREPIGGLPAAHIALDSAFVVTSRAFEQPCAFKPFQVRQIAQALERELRQELPRRHIGVRRTGLRAAGPGGDQALRVQRSDQIAAHLPPQHLSQLPPRHRLEICDRNENPRLRFSSALWRSLLCPSPPGSPRRVALGFAVANQFLTGPRIRAASTRLDLFKSAKATSSDAVDRRLRELCRQKIRMRNDYCSRPVMPLGSGGAQEWRFGLEQGRHVRFWLSERCPQSIAKLAVQIWRPDLHEHVSTVERPAHLLLLDHPFADERVHC